MNTNPNEGRHLYTKEEIEALSELLASELTQIRRACMRIERKMGQHPSEQRTEAIRFGATTFFTSFTNLVCATFGWAEAADSSIMFHSASSFHHKFVTGDFDFMLSSSMNRILRLLQTEPYETVESVQQARKELK